MNNLLGRLVGIFYLQENKLLYYHLSVKLLKYKIGN